MIDSLILSRFYKNYYNMIIISTLRVVALWNLLPFRFFSRREGSSEQTVFPPSTHSCHAGRRALSRIFCVSLLPNTHFQHTSCTYEKYA